MSIIKKKIFIQYLKWTIFGFSLFLMVGIMGLAILFRDISLNYDPALTTRIYDRNGQLIYEVYEDENRVWVSLEEISPHLQNATVAMEDDRFYDHVGFDPVAIVRALHSIVFKDELQGASTITQQFAKNAFLTSERTVERKLREAIIAVLLELRYPKDVILEAYLNEVPYGGVYYGVASASRFYFGKNVSDLSLAESATLAAFPKAPTALSPYLYGEGVIKSRQLRVLQRMEDFGYITSEQRKEAAAENINFVYQPPVLRAPHFSMYVRQQLVEEFGKEAVFSEGLEVFTTLDLGLQQYASKVVQEEVSGLEKLNVYNGAVLITDPKNGNILAMVGSRDYYSKEIEGAFNVTAAWRQPGSAIKPVLYAQAFEEGYTPATILFDIPTTYSRPWGLYSPVNYDGRFRGPVTIREALAGSYNVPATRMLAVLGVQKMKKQGDKMGIPYYGEGDADLSLALGGEEVRPLDMAKVYGILANNGEKINPNSLLKVKDSSGHVLYEFTLEKERAVSAEIAFLLSDILADNWARVPAFGGRSPLHFWDVDVAVKTGTSDHKRDNWAIGYTPDFVVVAWVGNNDNSPMHPALATGVTGAAPIWRKVTEKLLEERGATSFEKPENVVAVEISSVTGQLYCGEGERRIEYFIVGTEPTECGELVRVLVYSHNDQWKILGEISEEDEKDFRNDPEQFLGSKFQRDLGDGEITNYSVELRSATRRDPLLEEHTQRGYGELAVYNY